MPLTWRHIYIETVASLGQFIGTTLSTVVGVMIPLINILRHPELSSSLQGLIGAVSLVGIALGAMIFGRLIDKYGYLLFFRLCPLLILVAALVSIFVTSLPVLIICLFIVGFGIGGEYSLDSGYISELMPEKWRFLMVGIAKAASALGNIAAAAFCFFVVNYWKDAEIWPRLMWIIAATAILMLLLRIWFYQSPQWLLEHGKTAEAQKAVQNFLGKNVYIEVPEKNASAPAKAPEENFITFTRKNLRQVIFGGIPWACEGLGVYGIGVFLPILVMSLGLEAADAGAPVMHVLSSVEVTLWISCIILPGFLLGLVLINRVYGVKIQYTGFLGSAVALVILLLAYHYQWDKWISIVAFMAFELFLNFGPHLMTYVLPPKIFPVEVRGQGTGIVAAIGKVGAVLGVFFIPVLLHWGGVTLVLIVSAAVMLAGGIVTRIYGRQVLPPQ